MGYKITYGKGRSRSTKEGRWRLPLLTAAFFLLFSILVRYLYADELRMLCAYILPMANLDALIEDLRQGQSAVDAIAAFCEDFFHGQ